MDAKKILFHNKKISYTLRKSRNARRVRIAVQSDASVVVTVPYVAGEEIAERFLQDKMQWVLAKIAFFRGLEKVPMVRYGKRDYAVYKENARVLAERKVAHFNVRYGHEYRNIRIKNQKTCWGSCSKKGNLNFNFRILFLPEHVQDYIVVHELCHLKELNHSKRFWGLVAQAVPEYLQIRKELRQNKIGFV
ncbi:MAG: M48 family metallopeptidase [Candidatus Sungbacteria bacterium]|nr:M48 family metallopeptidase [Candidatus Sungbacteria bacterium]